MEPQRLIGQAVYSGDHRGRYVGRLEDTAPLRNQLAITGEHDCLWRLRRDIHRNLSATVVLKRLGDERSSDGHCRCLVVRSGGGAVSRISNVQPVSGRARSSVVGRHCRENPKRRAGVLFSSPDNRLRRGSSSGGGADKQTLRGGGITQPRIETHNGGRLLV